MAVKPQASQPKATALRRFLLEQWRDLTKMRTAVLLLAIVAGLSIIASMLPQKAIQPVRATGWVQGHQVVGPLFDNLGFFSMYDSPWLLGAATLMYVSLSHCVLTRGRAVYRRWRRGLPRNGQFIGEVGSLIFHLSFFVLLAGILWGKAAGFTAFVNVLEGQSVVEGRASYDQIEEGILSGEDAHRGFRVQVDSFQASYYNSGKPKDFVSTVEVFDQGQKVMAQDVRVNQYLEYRDIKFYQASYGWAPMVNVTDPRGRAVFSGPTIFFGDPALANGILKVPAAGPPGQQLGALMFFVPDVQPGPGTRRNPGTANLRNPALFFRFFKGDLHADRVQNVYSLDTSAMSQFWTGALFLGETTTLPNGYTVSFPKVIRYSGLQVTHDPGLPIVWASFGLMLGGLMVRLYLRPLLEAKDHRAAEKKSVPPAISSGAAA